MLLLSGLGNPGPEHAWNRHNVGFMALDAIAQRYGFAPYRARFHGLVADGRIDGERVVALKPSTYMNRSGIAVGEAARFYKLGGEDVVVLHDELDLVPGKIRIKIGGSTAGHNGLRSIDSHYGKTYRRLRIGIGHPGDKRKVQSYVLNDFSRDDQDWLDPLLGAMAEAAPHLARHDDSGFMSRVQVILNPRPPRPRPGAENSEEDDGI
jgi:peptidyl-tRNA hydrolase, PTH1 family